MADGRQHADEAVEVLRDIWRAQGQNVAEVFAESGGKSCKRMAAVGYAELAGDTDDPVGAWKARLAREGKLRPGGSLRELVLGSGDPPGPAGTGTHHRAGHHPGQRADEQDHHDSHHHAHGTEHHQPHGKERAWTTRRPSAS
ncbi:MULTISPECIES: hypothetical protein [Thermocrispum]|jgi:hypothetical protein|uniref:Uncharacterized protein n=1 Tax=Thermocrispum agreste TaxID=37925 RepID=A0A2W4M113_9PSEU|nr:MULTISPECIES: hypothetical protein [Thermocrispum]PZN01557.1 MAG: hypothetical protein DIU77_00230 [Thermocrispum agreste]